MSMRTVATRWSLAVPCAVLVGSAFGTAAREDATVRAVVPKVAPADGRRVPGIQTFKLPAGTVFKRHVVGERGRDGSVAGDERVIYSNTKGTYAVALPPRALIADDISTTAGDDCPLSRYTFQVTGKVDPSGVGGPYAVEFALYHVCPGVASPNMCRPWEITGTMGYASFPDDAPRTIEFVIPGTVPIPTTFWLGLSVSRANAGVIMGAPAMEGFSGDVFDYPWSACDADLGGFPDVPHASFNAELFGGAGCPAAHLEYRAAGPEGPTFNPGASRWFADDLELAGNECRMIAYEVGVRGPAQYNFELRETCSGPAITGTQRTRTNHEVALGTHLLQFTVDPPVLLPKHSWLAIRVNHDTGGVIVAGRQADIGNTKDVIGRILPGDTCEVRSLPDWTRHSAFHVSITCEGQAPKGACCDMYITECAGGPDDGKPCEDNDDCTAPGSCESVCREVPEANCPFPPARTDLRPRWVEGATCDSEPFEEGTCGQAACCYKDEKEEEYCANLTRNDCHAIPPLENKRKWEPGKFCSVNQYCPLNVCIGAAGHCYSPNPTPGCDIEFLCSCVCNYPNQYFCCDVVWDRECVDVMNNHCDWFKAANDECYDEAAWRGATELEIPAAVGTSNWVGSENSEDPDFCCYGDSVRACSSGQYYGRDCQSDEDCLSFETCVERPRRGLNTVWYEFEATHTSARVSTCGSRDGDGDSLLQVFAAGDPTSDQTACNTLHPIGCSDDELGCGAGEKLSDVCVQNLVPGEKYYVLVASKGYIREGHSYRLDLTAPCDDVDPVPNDYCQGALSVDDGTTEFDMTGATLHCPADLCAPDMVKDLWYEYTATCTGIAAIDTCSPDAPVPPDTNLLAYEGCDLCPAPGDEPLACNRDSDRCEYDSLASRIELPVIRDECYKIRVGTREDSHPVGQLNITCEPQCPEGPVAFVDPSSGTVDARRPHGPVNFSSPMGIDTIIATAPPDAASICWRLCETLAAGGKDNFIAGVYEGPPGTYTISTLCPITPDALTTIEYLGNDPPDVGWYIAHPGNVNGDDTANAHDVVALVGALADTISLPWGLYSSDIDRSGVLTPLDILDAIDILNGADAYDPPRNGSAKPSTVGCP